jgi:hypothetical protein
MVAARVLSVRRLCAILVGKKVQATRTNLLQFGDHTWTGGEVSGEQGCDSLWTVAGSRVERKAFGRV